MANKSFNSIKEIGSDFWNGLDNRRQRMFDSKYDFFNWATIGIPDAVKSTTQSNGERGTKAFNSGSAYDYFNWATMGSGDMIKETFNPEDPYQKNIGKTVLD